MRVTPEEFERIDLRAHSLLSDVPLHDVWRVELPGGGPDRLDRPARLAIGPEGRLYVADRGNDRVLAFDVSTPASPQLTQTYGPGSGADALDEPIGVAVDGSFVYVADSANGRVQLLQKGNSSFIQKPFGIDDLSVKLREMLDGS